MNTNPTPDALASQVREVVQQLASTHIGLSLDRWCVLSNTLLSAATRLEALQAQPAGEAPTGAIENGREFLRRLAEHYAFECEAGSLAECYEYTEAVRCFEYMAEHIAALTASPPVVPMRVWNDETKTWDHPSPLVVAPDKGMIP